VAGSSGFAVDGYLSGATILCDANANGEADAGEASTTTDSSGFFQFNRACSAGLVATGGTSTDTNLPFRGKLKAPPGATMVTPLTTLLSSGMTLDQINAALGLPTGTDVTSLDPARVIAGEYQRADLFRKTLAIQQILQKTAETLANLAGAGASAALPTIYSEVAAAMAAQLRTAPPLLTGNAIDAARLTSLVNAAATRVAASTALSDGIRAGLAGVNTASLAEVIAGALKVQSDRILQSANAQIVSTTTTAQSDTRIADFALQNRGALAAAPGSTTTALASDIASTINGGVAPPPPPPPTGGAVLATFDEATPPAVTEFGGAGYAIEAGPAGGGTGNALRISRPGGDVFAGAWVAIPAVPNNAGTQTVSARVYSPTAGIPFVAKLEFADNAGTGDRVPNETVVAGWQTLTWTFSNLTAPNVYNRFTILPNLGTVGTGQDYFIDDITLVAGGGGGGGGTTGPITFSSGFAANARTVEGGEFGGFSGSNLDGFNCSGDPAFCGGGGENSPAVPAADSYFFYYYQTPTPASALYAGVHVQAPGVTGGLSGTADTAGVRINGQTTMRFNFNPNPEWYQSATNNFMVQLDMGRLYLVGGNPCHVQLRRVVTPTSATSVSYTVNLGEFAVVQNCAVPGLTAAAALADSNISQISFQAAGGGSSVGDGSGRMTGANLSVPAGAVYPTTIVLRGAISFQ
jgi:hypothetical protein